MAKVTFTDNGVKIVMADGKGAQFVALASAEANRAKAEAESIADVRGKIERIDTPSLAPMGSATTNVANASRFINPNAAATYDRRLYRIKTRRTGSVSVQILVPGATAGTVSKFGDAVAVPAVANEWVYLPAPLKAPAGSMPSVSGDGLTYLAGAIPGGKLQWTVAAGVVGTDTAYSSGGTNGIHIEYGFIGEIAATSEEMAEISETVGAVATVGWPSPIVATGSDVSNYTIFDQERLTAGQKATKLTIGSAGGSATLYLATFTGTTIGTLRTLGTYPLVAGVNTIALNVDALDGEYLGVFCNIKFQNSVNPTARRAWIKSGTAPAVGNVLSDSAQHRYEVQFDVKSGLLAEIGAVSSSSGGMNLLDDADPTGATDATALITAAQAAHPNPYVPPGDYLVTSIPCGGNGLWGPGRLIRSGRRFYLPSSPRATTHYEALRQRLATCIGTGAPLIVIGDSIAHWAFATEANNHWLDQLCAMANINHSPLDVPIMTSFGNLSSYTPAFYGVTLSGTTSGGTRGPIGNATAGSVVLASGAAMTFTGTFEEIAFSYVRESGAGTLTVARGGTTLATIDASGALDLDRWSGLIATGVTTSATYTITASGGPVEITSLLRRGVRTASDVRRLNVMRAARGSFTFGDYTQPVVDSILKISSHLSASPPTVMIALGINDAAGTATASAMATAAHAVIDRFIAGGVSDFMGILPLRPDETIGAWQTRTENYDAVLAGLTQSYRSRNVQIIRTAADYLEGGKLSDGLHPNDPGFVLYTRQLLEQMA